MNVFFHKDRNDDTITTSLAAHNGFWALFDTVHKEAFMERFPTGKPTSTAQKSCIIWENSHGGIKRRMSWIVGLLGSMSNAHCVMVSAHARKVIWYHHSGSDALNMNYKGGEKESCVPKKWLFSLWLVCEACVSLNRITYWRSVQ